MKTISEESFENDIEEQEVEDGPPKIGLYVGGRNAASERHGRGWAILPNGDQYDGQYRRGKRHGIGLYVFKGGARYYGRYRCGKRHGRGIFIYPDGSIYEGCFRKNMKHGKGRYSYVNGDTYAGDWYRGERHGVGVYTYNSKFTCSAIRFKGTWQNGIRYGPFEIYFGTDERCTVLHGTWANKYPLGPAVFSFDQRYVLCGYFQAPPVVGEPTGVALNAKKTKTKTNYLETEMGEDEMAEEEMLQYENSLPTIWVAQEMDTYCYSQLPQEPVPLPLTDSDISVCSLSTEPTEMSIFEGPAFMGEGEEEGEGECVPCECEGDEDDIETNSEICGSNADPCAIDVTTKPKC